MPYGLSSPYPRNHELCSFAAFPLIEFRYQPPSFLTIFIMLSDVGNIPAKPSGPFAPRSIGSFRRALEYVDLLYEECPLGPHQLGWMQSGMLFLHPLLDFSKLSTLMKAFLCAYTSITSLGVFFWATRSALNRRVPSTLARVNSTIEVG